MDGKLRGSAATCDDQERRLHALGTAQQERLLLHDCKGGPGSDGATALVFGIQVAFAHRYTSDVMIAIPATRIVRNLS